VRFPLEISMFAPNQEIEVKFFGRDLQSIEARLQVLGGRLSQARVHEINLRYDLPSGDLVRTYQTLRLRQDNEARMTYKGPGQVIDGVKVRKELEFVVSDFKVAQEFLQALGYQVVVMYEKYRTIYDLDGLHITLDELPYGNFVEIEGPDSTSIHEMALRLGLRWEARIQDSYLMLLEKPRQALGVTFRDLSFDNFAGLQVSPEALGVQFGFS